MPDAEALDAIGRKAALSMLEGDDR